MGNALFLYIIYNVLTKSVERANQHLVFVNATEGKVEQDKGCCGKACRPMRTPCGWQSCAEQVADDAVCDIPKHKQYHAERSNPHLQSTALEEPDVKEREDTRDDEYGHHDGAEGEHVLPLGHKPQIVHIHLLHALACHEMSDWRAEAADAEQEG